MCTNLRQNTKYLSWNSNHDSSGYILSCFEPIELRFNLKDALNNFIFANLCAKRHKNDGEGLKLDTHDSS